MKENLALTSDDRQQMPALTLAQLQDYIDRIQPADRRRMEAAAQRQAMLAKPPGSLGRMEDMAVRLAGILAVRDQVPAQASQAPAPMDCDDGRLGTEAAGWPDFRGKGCVLIFCADNGVVAQGVASAPSSVTRAQTINFTRRLTGVSALARSFGSDLLIVDVGVKDPIPDQLYDPVPFRDTRRIVRRGIRPGTWDISQGPAMTEGEALQGIAIGIEMAEAAAGAGFDVVGIGEMGIGNTTTSAAVLSAITGASAEDTCGRGGGVNDAGLARKKQIVDQASASCRAQIARRGSIRTKPEQTAEDLITILARCGGFDLCAMTGAFLGAAGCGIPVVIDGYISAVAALTACRMAPVSRDYMFASHRSQEPGYQLAIREVGLKPCLDLQMRLGEGSGCPIAFELLRGSWDVFRNMATFAEAQIDDGYLNGLREAMKR